MEVATVDRFTSNPFVRRSFGCSFSEYFGQMIIMRIGLVMMDKRDEVDAKFGFRSAVLRQVK